MLLPVAAAARRRPRAPRRAAPPARPHGAASTPSASASGGEGASAIVGSSAFNDAALQALTTKIQGAIGSKSLSGVKIAMITNGNASYWNEAKAGWNAAMKWLGGKGASGEFTEPTSSTASVQVSLLETLTTQGYTGWGVSAVTASSLTTPIAQAVAKGVSVVAYDSPLPGTKAQLYIGTPNTTAGCDAGKAMTQAIGSGDVVAISGSLTAANTQQRVSRLRAVRGLGRQGRADPQRQPGRRHRGLRPAGRHPGQPEHQGHLRRVLLRRRRGRPGGHRPPATPARSPSSPTTASPNTVSDVKSGLIAASILQRPYYQGYMLAYVLAADKVLGDSATMALVKPYFDGRPAATPSAPGWAS